MHNQESPSYHTDFDNENNHTIRMRMYRFYLINFEAKLEIYISGKKDFINPQKSIRGETNSNEAG